MQSTDYDFDEQKIGTICANLRVNLLGMFQDANDIAHHLNAHVIENVLKGMGMKSVKFVHRSTVHEQLQSPC